MLAQIGQRTCEACFATTSQPIKRNINSTAHRNFQLARSTPSVSIRRIGVRAVELEDIDVLSSVNFEHSEEGMYCMPGSVTVQSDDGPYTMISMQVKDYPGLLRVVSWVFNGLELVVKKAKAGAKLKRSAADLTAERIGDFLVYCTPSEKAMQATFFEEGPITISNKEHSDYTVVTTSVALEVEGALLKVASALTNSGCSIQEGTVETIGSHGREPESIGFGVHEGQREFKFLVTDRSGRKLDYQRATSLLYTMGLVFGKSEGPLIAPNTSKWDP